jgi:hypothetical protein
LPPTFFPNPWEKGSKLTPQLHSEVRDLVCELQTVKIFSVALWLINPI